MHICIHTHNGMCFNYQTYAKQLSYGQKNSARPNLTQASLVMQSHANECCIMFLSPDRHQQPLATQMSAEYDLFNQGSAVRYFEDWLGGWKTGLVVSFWTNFPQVRLNLSMARNQDVNSLDWMNSSTSGVVHLAPLQVFLVIPLSIPIGIPIGVPHGLSFPRDPQGSPRQDLFYAESAGGERKPSLNETQMEEVQLLRRTAEMGGAAESDGSLESWLVTVSNF